MGTLAGTSSILGSKDGHLRLKSLLASASKDTRPSFEVLFLINIQISLKEFKWWILFIFKSVCFIIKKNLIIDDNCTFVKKNSYMSLRSVPKPFNVEPRKKLKIIILIILEMQAS